MLCACSSKAEETTQPEEEIQTLSFVEYDAQDLDDDISDEDVKEIILSGSLIESDDTGIQVTGSDITITEAGTYRISGTLDDGMITINTAKEDFVHLVLDNATINCSDSAPLYIKQASKVVITLAENSTNIVNDGSEYAVVDAEEEISAAIYAKDDLTINGSGTLEVNANYNNGIQSKDNLKIVNGTIQITAPDDGLVGKDLLAVRDGVLQINAQGDGMKTTNAEETDKGMLVIDGGSITLNTQQDGMQAENALYVYDGSINIQTGGGSAATTKSMQPVKPGYEEQSTEDTISKKGLKGVNNIIIAGGEISINTEEDSIHSNNAIEIAKASIQIQSGDDAIHADNTLVIQSGTIDITQSYEGLEALDITINDGSIHLIASDDGINAASGNDSEGMGPQTGSTNADIIRFNGGTVVVDAGGDGLDSNGSIEMNGGTVIVNGPVDSGNGALDYDGTFTINGGQLYAAGSAGMMQNPSAVTNGNCITIVYDSNLAAQTITSILDANGTSVLTFQPQKAYQSLILYSASLQTDTTYQVSYGGTAEGSNTDGIYENEAYTGGSILKEFTVSEGITSVSNGNVQTMGGGPQGNGGMRPR